MITTWLRPTISSCPGALHTSNEFIKKKKEKIACSHQCVFHTRVSARYMYMYVPCLLIVNHSIRYNNRDAFVIYFI